MKQQGSGIIYSGEQTCVGHYKSGKSCTNAAYYVGPFCGMHSSKKHREKLPKNPKAAQVEIDRIKESVDKAMVPTDKPRVTATKMRMMQKPKPRDGYLLCCPNNKHGHNFGYPGDYSSLSPMKLGPVLDEKGAILALNIENYHQFAKVFPCEMITGELCECGRSFTHYKALPAFYEAREKAYGDPIPHRHKFDSKDIKKQNKDYVKGTVAAQVNTPMYSVQFTPEERHFTYVESRWFYCNQMEVLSTQRESFRHLQKLYQTGHSIDIHGYDAYEPKGTDAQSLYEHYCDESRPFGHEMVILTLLVLKPEEYPWTRYRKERQDVYETLGNKKLKTKP